VTVLTDVPEELAHRGIVAAERADGFAITLDAAEPWGGGRVEGRVERRGERRDARPVSVELRCEAAWLDIAPQLVGKKRFLSLTTYWDVRTRSMPIWVEDVVFVEREELGSLAEANWLHFAFVAPEDLPRAVEGTFVAFRWRVAAERRRRIGKQRASLPILLREPQTLPTVRVETSPIGSWRLLDWKAAADRDGAAGPCAVGYERRQPEDMPLPGETREAELARRRSE
jgi:hypothetical protein